MVRTITEPQWTDADRALMLALQSYEASLCSGCGHPRTRAWHPDMDGWYEPKHYKCAACSAIKDEPVHYSDAIDDRDVDDLLRDVPLEVSAPDRPD